MDENWDCNIECIEWADGSIDAVYVNQVTGDVEWRAATQYQIEAHKRHKEWVAAGCPDFTISFSDMIRG